MIGFLQGKEVGDMKISELRDILYELQYDQGDIDIYALVTRESGYLLDCHTAVHKNPFIKTGEYYTIVCENTYETRKNMATLDGFPENA